MDVKEMRNVGFFRKRLDIGDFFYDEKGEPRPKEEAYIVLREPTSAEFNRLSGVDKDQNFKVMIELLPKLILEHNLESDGQPAIVEEVAKTIIQSASCFVYVSAEWQKSLPLVKRNVAALKDQLDQSSQET